MSERSDTERLDWCEKNAASAYQFNRNGGEAHPMFWMIEHWGNGYRGYDRYSGQVSPTLRAAIDAAMDAERSKEGR